MSVYWYLLVEDKELKRVLVVEMGTSYYENFSWDLSEISDKLEEIEDLLNDEDVMDVEYMKISEIPDINVGTLIKLIRIKQLLEDIAYGTGIHPELSGVLKLYFVVDAFNYWWFDEDRIHWELVSEYGLSDKLRKLEQDGYEVIIWGNKTEGGDM